MPVYYYTMFKKIDSDTQEKILDSRHFLPPFQKKNGQFWSNWANSCSELSEMPVFYYTMFEKIDSDTQVKVLASGHYAGVYLPGAMSERVKDKVFLTCMINAAYQVYLSGIWSISKVAG